MNYNEALQWIGNNLFELSKTISIIIASFVTFLGVHAWKSETRGKREMELAEQTLALFYECRDNIRYIRNPFSLEDEGSTRKKEDHEIEIQSNALDRAYIIFERYNKVKEAFTKLRSLKYRFMAIFGQDKEELFEEFNKIMRELFFAANVLGDHYWQKRFCEDMNDDQRAQLFKDMRKYENKLYDSDDDDEINTRINALIQAIEVICSNVLNPRK